MKRYDDSKYINKDTVHDFANTNEHLIAGGVNGVIAELPGLGGGSCLGGSMDFGKYETPFAKKCAGKGIVLAYMFPGPWSWGARAAVRMTDGVVTALADKYSLPEGFPVAVCGGSMGGLGALIYAIDSSYEVAAAAAACPCVDVFARYPEKSASRRSFISAVGGYDMPLDEALASICPTRRIDELPDVPYFICSDGDDEPQPEPRCNAFVELLEKKGLNVTYRRQPGKKHGDFFPEVRAELEDFLIDNVLKRGRSK